MKGVCVEPVKGVNQRRLNLDHKIEPAKQKMAYYPANVMPVPNDLTPQPVDRKAAMVAATALENPALAMRRKARAEPPPAHYQPTMPNPDGPVGANVKPAVYGGGTKASG